MILANRNSRILIISDLHLSKSYNHLLYQYLENLINQYDHIILNGDIWDFLKTTYEDFCTSDWAKLLRLLKTKQTVYINGNHDPKHVCTPSIDFCISMCKELIIKVGTRTLYISHGDNDNGALNRIYRVFHNLPFFIRVITLPLMILARLDRILIKYNIRVSRWLANKSHYNKANKLPNNSILVAGHTHNPEYNLSRQYINTGFIDYGFASYLEIVDMKVNLVYDKY